ncbi:MAG: tetratricopeptide repeat protein [Candidatus Obscuribacterales bacterium]|nr:tetratricopeptide repeat protein [Candidatus Obscuribacterales bacterium]
MNDQQLRDTVNSLADQQKQLMEQQKQLLERINNSQPMPLKKDRWDRVGAVAPILSAIIIASGGAWFTAIYNQQQLKLQEIQTIEKFFPHLTGDEKSKKAAILAISSLTDAKLASNVAAIYASEGTVSALEQIARHGEKSERKMVNGALARALDSVAENYETEKRYEEATRSYERALALREESFGLDSPRILPSLNRLVELYKTHRDFSEAEALLQRAIIIQKSTYGADSPQVALELRRLADLYKVQGHGEKSNAIAARASAIEKNQSTARVQVADNSDSDDNGSIEDKADVSPASHSLTKIDDSAVGLDSNIRPATEKRVAPVNMEQANDRAVSTDPPVADQAKQANESAQPATEPVKTSEQHRGRATRL